MATTATPANFTPTTWQTIYSSNKSVVGTNPNLIKPGQQLTLPNGSTYTVVAGDNLTKIAAGKGKGMYSNPTTTPTSEVTPISSLPEPAPTPPVSEPPPPPPSPAIEGNTPPSVPEMPDQTQAETNRLAAQNEAATPVKPISVATNNASTQMREPRDNPLSQFSSHTYNITLYAINPDTFNLYTLGEKLVPKDWKVICRSGGGGKISKVYETVNVSDNVATDIEPGSQYSETFGERAEGFELDYYIDNLRIVTAINGKETMTTSTSFDFSFDIIEPYGFKFPTNLVKAAYQIQRNSKIKLEEFKQQNLDVSRVIVALQTQFLLMIRFYGYDKDGNILTSSDFPNADKLVTDPQSVFERSFPIQLTSFEFKLDNKSVVYHVKAKTVSEEKALGRYRGYIGDNTTLQGSTVKEMLAGNSKDNTGNNIKGLIQYLNDKQQELVDKGEISVADFYAIEFEENSGIDSATMVALENVSNDGAPNASVKKASDVNEKTALKSNTINKSIKVLPINRGDHILTVIDQIITSSSYVTDALNINSIEKTQTVKETDEKYKEGPRQKLMWYSVIPQVELREYDAKRNTFACKILYVISKYSVPYVRSISANQLPTYNGPHKRYKHWYMSNDLVDTSKHQKEILSYEQGYNLLYFTTAGYGSGAPIKDKAGETFAPISPTDGSGSNQTGKLAGKWNEVIGPLKTFLYSPSDQLNARITILGDPDYLMTSVSRGLKIALNKHYGEDGYSINPNSGQVFIEIAFRQVEDYNKETGLLDPSKDGEIIFWPYPASIKDKIQGVAYMVWQVTSNFSRGLFTQDLRTCIPPFNYEGDTSGVNASNEDTRADANINGLDLPENYTTVNNSAGGSDPSDNERFA